MANKITEWFKNIEWRWSLITQVGGLVSSFALPAWAVDATDLFAAYSPLSWVIAGFCGAGLFVLGFVLWQIGLRIRIRAKFDQQFLNSHGRIDPMASTFENKRIFLNDFVLPSHPLIEGKTFINCDIIGPANMFLISGNAGGEPRPPQVDAVYLAPNVQPVNGFAFRDCVFRRCSLQRVTLFVNPADYSDNQTELLNWISLTPNDLAQEELPLPLPPETQDDDQQQIRQTSPSNAD